MHACIGHHHLRELACPARPDPAALETQAVQYLIDEGVDIGAANSFGATALMQSAHYGGPTHLLTPHLTPEQVNQRNVFNWTAFTWAGKGGHAESAKALFEAGGDIEAKNMKGSTPLLEASTGQYEKNGNEEIIPVLIGLGANVKVTSEDGDTPLHNAAYLGWFQQPSFAQSISFLGVAPTWRLTHNPSPSSRQVSPMP